MQIITKISVASVFGKVKNAFVFGINPETKKNNETPDNPVVQVMRVYGNATGFEIKSGDLGDSFKFSGSFEAVNLSSGEVFKSSTCFLPATAAGLLAGALDGAQSVQFGFDIAAKFREDVAIGYEYMITPLVDSSASDPLSMLAASLPPLQIGNDKATVAEVAKVEETTPEKPAKK